MSEIKTKEYEKPENIISPNSEFSIEVNNLRKIFSAKKGFDDVIAVDDISFKVKSGELFGFLGPNGAGKTTTINMLIGLLKPTSGTAIINGYDVKDGLYHIKQLIGVCPQEPAIFKFLTGKEMIELFGGLHSMTKAEIKERTNRLLEILNLSNASKRKTKGYSGGMLRQLNLIIALINDPKIAFLDEPTVGLDPELRFTFWEYFTALTKQGTTLIISSHTMDDATHCDCLAFMRDGRVIAQGAPGELKQATRRPEATLEDAFLYFLHSEDKKNNA